MIFNGRFSNSEQTEMDTWKSINISVGRRQKEIKKGKGFYPFPFLISSPSFFRARFWTKRRMWGACCQRIVCNGRQRRIFSTHFCGPGGLIHTGPSQIKVEHIKNVPVFSMGGELRKMHIRQCKEAPADSGNKLPPSTNR